MFNEEKATELAASILSWGGSMKFVKLLKLIYLADREALDREGHSISTDRWVIDETRPGAHSDVQSDTPRRRPPIAILCGTSTLRTKQITASV